MIIPELMPPNRRQTFKVMLKESIKKKAGDLLWQGKSEKFDIM